MQIFHLVAVCRGRREGILIPVVGVGIERGVETMFVEELLPLPCLALRVPEELHAGMEDRESRFRGERKPSTVTDGGRIFDAGLGLMAAGADVIGVGNNGAMVLSGVLGDETVEFWVIIDVEFAETSFPLFWVSFSFPFAFPRDDWEEVSEEALPPLYILIPGLLTTTLGPISPEVRRVCVGGVGVGGGDVEIDADGDKTETPF